MVASASAFAAARCLQFVGGLRVLTCFGRLVVVSASASASAFARGSVGAVVFAFHSASDFLS